MATKRALEILAQLTRRDQGATSEIKRLWNALNQVNELIDRILADTDEQVEEVVVEDYQLDDDLILSETPIVEGSVVLYLDGSDEAVDPENYTVDYRTGVITPLVEIPEGVLIEAIYTRIGLATQIDTLLDVVSDLESQYFLDRRGQYQDAVDWIEANFDV